MLTCVVLCLLYLEGAWARLDPGGQFGTRMKESIAVNRLGEVEELANFATYVVSDYASWLTSEVIVFDGGQLSKMSGMFNDLSQVLQYCITQYFNVIIIM